MFESIIVGLITGALSSWAVSAVFYRKGRRDAFAVQLQGYLSATAMDLEVCDPFQKFPGRRGHDGLEPTAHRLGCLIRLLERTPGFASTVAELRPISDEMEALVLAFDRTSDAEKKRQKEEWQAAVAKMQAQHS